MSLHFGTIITMNGIFIFYNGKATITCRNFECRYYRNGYCGTFRPSCMWAGTYIRYGEQ